MHRSWRRRTTLTLAGLLCTSLLLSTRVTHAQSWPDIQSSPKAQAVLEALQDSPYQKATTGRVARETLVSGIYALLDPDGKYAPIFTDAKITRLKNGTTPWIDIKSGQPLNEAQTLALRQDMAKNLKKEQAIPFTYGSGATPGILVSAYDCQYCRRLEQELDAGNVNATVYVFPMSLQTNRAGPMEIAKNVWCNNTPDAAWKAMILSKKTPDDAPSTCQKDARQVAELITLFDIRAVPARIYPDGRVAQFKANDF